MPRNMVEWGSAWWSDKITEHASESVVYARGQDTATVHAAVAENITEGNVEINILQTVYVVDFIVPVSELVLAGSAVKPQRGDRITRTVAGVEEVYEVLPLNENRSYQPSDNYRNKYRIHTRRVS